MHFSVGPLSNGGGYLRGGFHISANKVGWENISTPERTIGAEEEGVARAKRWEGQWAKRRVEKKER